MHTWGGMIGFWIVIAIVIVLVFFVISKWNTGAENSSGTDETALDILKKRYANGELSEEEYERMKRELE